MAKDKKSFIAYTDWKDTFDALPDDKAGMLIKFIYAYVNDENPQTDDVLINAVFANIKNTLKRDLKKWEKQHGQRSEAGKRSAEVRKRNATLVNARSISSTVSVNDSVNVNDNVNRKEKKIPTYEDFKKYALEKKSNVNTDSLKLKYDAWIENGWETGLNKPIKNWKTTLLNTLDHLKTNGTSKDKYAIDDSIASDANRMNWD